MNNEKDPDQPKWLSSVAEDFNIGIGSFDPIIADKIRIAKSNFLNKYVLLWISLSTIQIRDKDQIVDSFMGIVEEVSVSGILLRHYFKSEKPANAVSFHPWEAIVTIEEIDSAQIQNSEPEEDRAKHNEIIQELDVLNESEITNGPAQPKRTVKTN